MSLKGTRFRDTYAPLRWPSLRCRFFDICHRTCNPSDTGKPGPRAGGFSSDLPKVTCVDQDTGRLIPAPQQELRNQGQQRPKARSSCDEPTPDRHDSHGGPRKPCACTSVTPYGGLSFLLAHAGERALPSHAHAQIEISVDAEDEDSETALELNELWVAADSITNRNMAANGANNGIL